MSTARPDRAAVETALAPYPAGRYSQGITWAGLLWTAGQTARRPGDSRQEELVPFAEQVGQALTNADAIARAAGTRLGAALRVTVYLRDISLSAEFDVAYSAFFADQTEPMPARTTVQATAPFGDIELDAVIPLAPSPTS